VDWAVAEEKDGWACLVAAEAALSVWDRVCLVGAAAAAAVDVVDIALAEGFRW